MVLEGRDVIQINATVIAGILILLTINSLTNTNLASHLGFDQNPKIYASVTIGFFAISSVAEIILSMIIPDYAQKRVGDNLWSKYHFSLWTMCGGFLSLMLFAVILYVDSLS